MSLMVQFGRFSKLAAVRSGLVLGILAGFAPAVTGQTLNLTSVKDATIRGGTYSTTEHGRDQILVTRKSDDLQYERRAVLTFDTETTLPASTTIQSATLVLTVRGGNNEVRQLAAYTVPVSFDNDDVTWRQRRTGQHWSNDGGDITGSPVMATASPTPGSQVSFDVTSIVQRVINGDYGSRYARFLITDAGSASRDSYREYHSLESSTSSARPRLTVTYGGSGDGGGSSSTTGVVTPDASGNLVLTPANLSARAGRWAVESNSGALSGSVVRHPDAGAAKLNAAAASPANYFEVQFQAVAGQPYRIWLRGRADNNSWANDSVFVQFSGSVTSSGSSTWRIGTTSATEINLEECSGCGLTGWMWEDNGWGSRGALGPLVYFNSTGTHTIRVQTREDGLAVDQILLSPSTYLSTRPSDSSAPPASEPPSGVVSPDSDGNLTLTHAAVTRLAGRWTVESASGALGGSVVRHPNAGAAKIDNPASSPANYFEAQFHAVAGQPYRIWLRGKADGDAWANDSVHVQFSGSVTSSGSATWRIGTTSGTTISLEECSGCGVTGWTWEDNGWGSRGTMGPLVYFGSTGTQTIRVQTREDGLSVDQIVLSPSTFLSSSPGGSSPAPPPPSSDPEPAPAPEPTGSILRVLHWNIQHGEGTDGEYNLERIADGIAAANPDVVSLNEVERFTGWGYEDQPARFASLLQARTGHTWYYHFASRSGASNAQGNLLLSRYRIESSDSHLLSYTRSVAQIRITVNGRAVNIFSTHLDSDSSSRRSTQMNELKAWVAGFPQQRIVAGDFNTWPSAGEIGSMTGSFFDVWAEAAADGTAVAYDGNSAGNTRNSRIDYIFLSHGASYTTIRGAQVFDLRNSSGVMPSDHRPLLGIFEVR
jgi:endonuclease/exonuclease/phosphatase family metal-dependent hydrolase